MSARRPSSSPRVGSNTLTGVRQARHCRGYRAAAVLLLAGLSGPHLPGPVPGP
jgi:hypothetical protein